MARPARNMTGSRPGVTDAGSKPYKQRGGSYSEVNWVSGSTLILGLWLILAPWALGYSGQDNAVWNQVIVGAAIALIALARVSAAESWAPLSWVNFVLGGWLIVAPFVLTYNETGNRTAIYWNDILIGAAVLVLALVSIAGARRSTTAGL